MKFGIDGLRVMPLSLCEFRENRYSEKHALLRGEIEIRYIYACTVKTQSELGYNVMKGTEYFVSL